MVINTYNCMKTAMVITGTIVLILTYLFYMFIFNHFGIYPIIGLILIEDAIKYYSKINSTECTKAFDCIDEIKNQLKEHKNS